MYLVSSAFTSRLQTVR